ncbi:hypothetical protein LguiA_035556 [Lonicera macranthoides]
MSVATISLIFSRMESSEVQKTTQRTWGTSIPLRESRVDMHMYNGFKGASATFQKPTTESLQVSLTEVLRNKVGSDGADIIVALYEVVWSLTAPRGRTQGECSE